MMRNITVRDEITRAAVCMLLVCAASIAQCQSTDTLTITLPGDVLLEMVRIPAGSFQMGADDPGWSNDNEQPVHTVNIDYDLYMGKYEVTQAQWLAIMGEWPGTEPSETYGVGDSYPAYWLALSDCRNFITALNTHITDTGQGSATLRLPSESEWEYACRAGTQTRFYFGDSSCAPEGFDTCDLDEYAWWAGNNSPNGTKEVGLKLPSAFGLYDMHGNMKEWVADYYHDYDDDSRPDDGSPWLDPHSPNGLVRGGYWYNYAKDCRSAARQRLGQDNKVPYIGFRLAQTIPLIPTPTLTPTPVPTPDDTLTIMLPGALPLEMVHIPAGSFMMGTLNGAAGDPGWAFDTEAPQHQVQIAYDFYMARYPLTQRQWLALMGSWPETPPTSEWGVGDNYPAYYLSAIDAKNYITALNTHVTNTGQGPGAFRLPSESEWEYACRAGSTTRFYFGDSDNSPTDRTYPGQLGFYAWFGGNEGTHGEPGYGFKPVGGKLPNLWGLYDMHGNVYEWCQDNFRGDYNGVPADGSAFDPGAGFPERVIRGGGWHSVPQYCRSANRNRTYPMDRKVYAVGIRLARDPDENKANRVWRVYE